VFYGQDTVPELELQNGNSTLTVSCNTVFRLYLSVNYSGREIANLRSDAWAEVL
jgi:hypothetical protein